MATLAGAPALPFTTYGISPARDGVLLGLGANTAIAEATSIYLRYDGIIAGQDSIQTITAGLRMTWQRCGDPGSTMRIGIISDTHGLLRPEAVERLAHVHHIIHAGDIGRADVISGLREIAPVTAVRGNIDRDEWAAGYPQTERVKLAGRLVYVLHNLAELDLDPAAAGIDVVVSGHSHQPKIETVNGVIYLNPGSAGPRRFSLPIALATLDLSGDAIRPSILSLSGSDQRQ